MRDRGEERLSGASFVKLTAFYDSKRKQVVVRCFGIEQAGNLSKDAVTAVDHSLKLFEYSCRMKKIYRDND